ncbi:MAG: CotH kinase family protein [Cytophagaceae bacterium]
MSRIFCGFILLTILSAFPSEAQVTFTSSNLPIVLITTNGQTIADEPKVPVQMGIIDNGPNVRNFVTDSPTNYNNYAGIEFRGSSSQSFPQKSYGFVTQDNAGIPLNVSLLGMPAEHDWILYAPYDDKTLIRNIITYELSRTMGHYAARTKLCELVIDGNYQGVYVLMEKIKRDQGRVDISKLTVNDVDGDNLTGGYIFKVDKTTGNGGGGWYSNFAPAVSYFGQQIYFLYDYPKDTDITPEQQTYIQNFVNDFETALAGSSFSNPATGYRRFINTASFIDFLIINEASRNVDGYRLSTFLYKEKNTKSDQIFIGPVWDYNLAWWNADYCDGNLATGWAYNFGQSCYWDGSQIPFWWKRLLQDPAFSNQLKCRWTSMRNTIMSETSLYAKIDSLTDYLAEAQVRHFQQWPILGQYTWPNPSPIASDYDGEIINLKTWITQRFAWLDSNMPGTCSVSSVLKPNDDQSLQVYPNPFKENFTLNLTLDQADEIKITLLNTLGQSVKELMYKGQAGNNSLCLDELGTLPAGSYLLKADFTSGSHLVKILHY